MTGNLYTALQAGFARHMDDAALILPDGTTLSYAALDDLSARFAACLKTKGVQPGDRVAVQVDKSAGNAALYLAVLRVGAVYQPLNTGYTLQEVEFFVDDAEPSLFICRPEDLPRYKGALNVAIEPMGIDDATGLWAEALACAPALDICPRTADDLAAILYTSGTTGRPKGAMLSHGNLQNNAEVLVDLWGLTDQDVLIHALPIFHVHGLFVALHCAMMVGAPMYFESTFNAARVRTLLPKATVLMGVPTFYTRLMAEQGFGPQYCSNMRLFISGSAPMTAEVHEAFEAASGHKVLERYGMTETGMLTSNPLEGDRVAGTVGFALPGTEVRVVGDTGAVEVRGPNVFSGYWRLPEKTKEEFTEDGFFKTGDVGTMDETGRLTLAGRAKDLIISGGYNIYPKEIETVLDNMFGVMESAVIGVAHKDLGEGVVAVLVADGAPPSGEQIQAALDETLARFKHPRRFYWVEELPRNTMGKVQKKALRKTYADAYFSKS